MTRAPEDFREMVAGAIERHPVVIRTPSGLPYYAYVVTWHGRKLTIDADPLASFIHTSDTNDHIEDRMIDIFWAEYLAVN